jgi:mRNA interferase MazF
MPSTTAYEKWDVVLVPFPFTNLKSTKRRPAVVVSPNVYNQSQDIVAAFITSNLQGEERVGDYKLARWKEAGLPKPSKLRMKFATIDKSLIIKKLGRFTVEDIKGVRFSLIDFFGIE